MNRRTAALLIIVLAVSAMIYVLATRQHQAVDNEPTPTDSKEVVAGPSHKVAADGFDSQPQHRPVEVHADGFVGSQACKDCHENEFTSWHASYHRRMTQIASPEAVLGRFDATPVVAYGETFTPSRRGDEFWIESVCLMNAHSTTTANPDSSSNRFPVVMSTGSHHMQVYWYSPGEGRALAQLPIAWLKETQSWVPTSALFISPPPQPLNLGLRRWNEVCIKCHTTNGQPRIQGVDSATPHVDTQVAEFGIACEACHGPGEQHVAWHQNQAGDKSDAVMVHPAKIDHASSSEICGQCHGNWLPDSAQGLDQYLAHGTCFRAGESLSDKRHIFGVEPVASQFIQQLLRDKPHYIDDRYWPDGMIRVSGGEYNGMVNSACFAESNLSCLSCHQLHQSSDDPRDPKTWANDQLRHDRLDQAACLQCHQDLRSESSQTEHSHHAFESSGNECQNCHMPHTSYGLLKAIRSHQISIPSVQESKQYGRPNACNQCHLDKTLAWTGEHLQAWYGIQPPQDLTEDERTYAASALWALTGDAGQRALAAWSLGWKTSQAASRTDWEPAVLAQLLADPYDAVRHIAHRSLKTLPGFADFNFNYVGPTSEHQRAAIAAFRIFQSQKKQQTSENETVLLTPSGQLNSTEFSRLNHLRNNRQVLLAE